MSAAQGASSPSGWSSRGSVSHAGSYYKHLDAVVMRDGQKFLTARCDTDVEGGKVIARLVVARPREVFRPLRTATLAEGKETVRWKRR